MASLKRASGVTLLEAMIAMGVLVMGSLGLLMLHQASVRMNTEARVVERATLLAQDLMSQMQTWNYAADPRLGNTTTANDADFADSNWLFAQPVGNFVFDHQESELETQAAPFNWLGVPSVTAAQLGFTRYWNVAAADYDSNGVLNGLRVAAIVRWQNEQTGTANRVVVIGFLPNPNNTN